MDARGSSPFTEIRDCEIVAVTVVAYELEPVLSESLCLAYEGIDFLLRSIQVCDGQ